MPPIATILVSLGSNLNPVQNLRRAIEILQARCRVIQVAGVWETPAVGTTGPNFFNSAVSLLTDQDPISLKFRCLRSIEADLGRVRTSDKYAPRTIDLDPVVIDATVLDERLWSYAYLALPVAELAPNLLHPQTKERLVDIASRLQKLGYAIPHPEVFST
jgi:2-amino-4-hydroxy-6-hydroxymethyldihydropteridine diphosphokinase